MGDKEDKNDKRGSDVKEDPDEEEKKEEQKEFEDSLPEEDKYIIETSRLSAATGWVADCPFCAIGSELNFAAAQAQFSGKR
jgi:hypothetical protein